ncbi:ATP-binding protein [Prosthecobacter vanneervenii]|uniref:AAA+ ATPase domain-containing protein n=1 Tax=Prosthecobacter vanneervenii TaxID=48466 RepID=A0A7W7Y6T7_9BACT|nr:hypothetical protein [Prosthecobacter vanneervenii]MBB5030537.1 hypothetical protein [Prosthecobacter vanneervenii]
MKSSSLASEALAAWTIEALNDGEKSLARQELPELDLLAFFRPFAAAKVPSSVSLAMVGFGKNADELKKIAHKAGVTCFSHFADDLHEAANWRNQRKKHPIIVAYARGKTAGVNTLRHFAGATSRELTLTLLRWAAKQQVFTNTQAHTKLLEVLGSMVEKDDIFSFEQVRCYLEVWSTVKTGGEPRDALPALGLLPDPNLFTDIMLVGKRLEQNQLMMSLLRDRTAGQMEAVRKRLNKALEKSKDTKEIKKRIKTFDKLQEVRRSPIVSELSVVTLDDALSVFAPPPADQHQEPQDPTEDEDDTSNRILNEKKLERTCAEALLDNREEDLEQNATALSEGLREALDSSDKVGDEGEWSCEVNVAGEPQPFQGRLDRNFVGWVRHFCQVDVWGGLIETNIPDIKRALEDFDRPGTLRLRPEELLQRSGKKHGLTSLLRDWDADLDAGTDLVGLWEQAKTLRSKLLSSLEELTHFPLDWFAGKTAVRTIAEEYMRIFGCLFGTVSKHYGAMVQTDPTWAKTTLDGLLALDLVQVRTRQQDGKVLTKVVLLPTHPLHLWRYWRLSNILRGLGEDLHPADRAAVIQEASAPVQFLSVIYASTLPDGRGAGRVLPVANDLHHLATFENLQNAYSGPDGQDALVYSVERFAAAHPLHVRPLRVVLVNPPLAGQLLLGLLKMLDGRKKRLVEKLRVEVRGTPHQAARLNEALLFDTREREIIEEKVASGRLELIVDRQPLPLDQILYGLKARPAHLVAVFDEAPVHVRRGGSGQRLPMSPFCARRKVAFHRRSNELRLEPTSGDPPFFEFIELIKHAEGVEGEGTPYAWPEAEALRQAVDSVVSPSDSSEEFGAQWFFLADRALPEEGEMRAQRLLRRREGQRQVLLASRDYESLARLMLPVFEVDTPNLLMPVPALQRLMAEGAHLIGAGLLDLVKAQEGRVDARRVIGLMGALLAARDYMRQHPKALLVSTDSQLARTWLRLGTQGDRCDLLGLREAHGHLIVECIEVKTTKGKPRDESDAEIARACEQVAATRKAIEEGLGDTSAAEKHGHYLSAPRNEMLKEVLVQGCMGRYADSEVREQWSHWLTRLFGPAPEQPQMNGCVVDVALGSAEEKPSSIFKSAHGDILLLHLNEMDVQRLLDPEGEEEEPPGNVPPANEPKPPIPPSSRAKQDSKGKPAPTKSTLVSVQQVPPAFTGAAQIILGADRSKDPVVWSPAIASNPHLMIAGLPGMGKTTCLINICQQLVQGGVIPIVFSYHDDIDDKLAAIFPDLATSDVRSLGFNPMRVTESTEHAHIESAGQLRDIFAAIFPDLGELQLKTLYGSLKTSFEEHGWGGTKRPTKVPAFRRFFELLNEQERPDSRTQTLLARLEELDDLGFFKAESGTRSLLDTTNPQVLCVHCSKSEPLQKAFASFSLYSIYQDMFRRGRQERITHAVIFDEAHRAAKLKLLPTMAKECRKYGIALIVASQEARDFDSSLLANIANYLVLRVTDQDAKVLSRKIASSDAQKRMTDKLKALPKYEAFFSTEGRKQPVQLVLGGS